MHSTTSVLDAARARGNGAVHPALRLIEERGRERPLQPFADGQERRYPLHGGRPPLLPSGDGHGPPLHPLGDGDSPLLPLSDGHSPHQAAEPVVDCGLRHAGGRTQGQGSLFRAGFVVRVVS